MLFTTDKRAFCIILQDVLLQITRHSAQVALTGNIKPLYPLFTAYSHHVSKHPQRVLIFFLRQGDRLANDEEPHNVKPQSAVRTPVNYYRLFHLLLHIFSLFDGLIARLILLTLSVTPSKIRQTISPTIKQNCTGSNVWQWTLVVSINWDECIIIVMQNRYKYSSPCTTYCTETRQKMDFCPICLWQNGLMPQKVNWRKIFNAFSTIWKPDLNGRLLPHFHDAVFVGRD